MSLLDTPELGLNDEALADLADGAVDVREPDPDAAQPLMVILPEASKDPDSLEEALAAMPNYDAKIATIVDGQAKLRDVKQLSTQLLATESISQSDAEEIATVLPALQDEVAPVQAYSQVPTRTNLQPTQRFVQRSVDALQSSTNAALDDLMTSDFKELLAYPLRPIAETLHEAIGVLHEQSITDLVALAGSKNFYAVKAAGDDRTKDLRETPLTEVISPHGYAALPASMPSYVNVSGLLAVLENKMFLHFHTLVCAQVRGDFAINYRSLLTVTTVPSPEAWSYYGLLSFFVTGGHRHYLVKFAGQIDELARVVAERFDDEGSSGVDTHQLLELMQSKAVFMNVLRLYRLLVAHAAPVLEAFRKNI